MRNPGIPVAVLVVIALPWAAWTQRSAPDTIPRLPGAELLVEGYLPERYLLTTEDRTITLQEDEIGLGAFPSISADGSIVASTHRVLGDRSRAPWLIASIYSVKDGKWTDHPEFENVKEIAISPDSSKLACVTVDRQLHVLDLPHVRFRVLDIKTGKITVVEESSHFPMGLSWSPDGRRIAFDMEPPDSGPISSIRAIYVANLETGKISQIGLGKSPSWSPSGEWIAFISYIAENRTDSRSPNYHAGRYSSNFYAGRYYAIDDRQISLMSPIGTHIRILMGFSSEVIPNLKPVWSPDSRSLLFNKSRDPDKQTFDIYTLDVVSGKAIKKFKNVGPVYGWVAAK